MIKYAKFLLSHSLVNIGLYVMAAFSAITSCLVYSLSVKSHNNELATTLMTNVEGGLLDNFYQNIIMYIVFGLSVIYIVIFINKTDRKEKFELTIISKGVSRNNIIITKILFSFMLVCISATMNLTLLSIPVVMDNFMDSQEKAKWIFSVYFGLMLIGLIFSSIVLLVSTFFNQLLSLIISFLLLLVMPLISIVSWINMKPDYRDFDSHYSQSILGLPISKKSDTNQINNGVVDRAQLIYSNASVDAMPNAISQLVVDEDGMKKHFNGIDVDSYTNFAANDPWSSINAFFSIFSPGKYNYHRKYRVMKDMSIDEIIEPNDNNSVEINHGHYFNIPRAFSSKHHPSYFMPPFTDAGRVKKGANYYNEIMIIAINYLNAHSDYSLNFYKTLSFLQQCKVWQWYINFFDKDNDKVEQFFSKNVDLNTLKPNHRIIGKVDYDMNHGFEAARHMIKLNKHWYEPDKFSDSQDSQNPFLTGIFPGSTIVHTIDNEEYPANNTGLIVWPIIAFMSIGLSILIYIKRDVK